MTEDQLAVFADCGGANFPIPDACTIAGCTVEDFAADPEYRARIHAQTHAYYIAHRDEIRARRKERKK